MSRKNLVGHELGLTLPWRGRVGARSAPGWGERASHSTRTPVLEHGRLRVTSAVELSVDQLQYSREVLRDVVIPEPDNTIPFRLEPSRASLVAQSVRLFAVLRSINLNDKS